MLLDEERNI